MLYIYMSHIFFYVCAVDDNGLGLEADDDYGEGSEAYNPDEGLTPIQKLEKYMESENFYNR